MKETRVKFTNARQYKEFKLDTEWQNSMKECWEDIDFLFDDRTLVMTVKNMGEESVMITGLCLKSMLTDDEIRVVKEGEVVEEISGWALYYAGLHGAGVPLSLWT